MPTPTDPNQAQAWVTGTPPDQTVDFYIPRGNTGPMGPVGPQGPSLVVGSVETNMGPAAPGTVGPQGLTGPKGDPGGLVVGTLLSTADLNAILTDGVYRQDAHANATSIRNYPVTFGGVLIVMQMQPTLLIQEYTPIRGEGVGSTTRYRREYTGTWSPWRATTTTRIDQTAGRVIYQWDDVNNRDQLIYGDTGYRDISALVSDLASGEVLLRRMGHLCSVIFSGVEFTNTSGILVHSYTGLIPVGFQSARSIRLPLSPSPGQVTTYGASGTFEIMKGMEGPVYGEIMWSTFNPWPTILPGTASGLIPNS